MNYDDLMKELDRCDHLLDKLDELELKKEIRSATNTSNLPLIESQLRKTSISNSNLNVYYCPHCNEIIFTENEISVHCNKCNEDFKRVIKN